MRSSLYPALAVILVATSCGNSGRSQAETPIIGASALADLRSEASDPQVRSFYEARSWRPAWDERQAEELTELLRGADAHGLSPQPLLAMVEGKQDAALEAGLTHAALALADALADGRLDPKRIREIYTIPLPRVDLIAGLGQAADRGEAAAWIASLAPRDSEYRALSQAYLAELARLGQEFPRIGSGDSIEPGEEDPRVPAIRAVLQGRGYLAGTAGTPAGASSTTYTAPMAAAVQAMQAEHGITADGVVGPDTVEVLNNGPALRARQLAVNLERRRWLPRNPPATRIDVNTASALLDYWRDGNHADRRRVIVGQPGWETPQLASPIFRLVANPTWTVPKSIEREEIAPKGAAYLRRNNMVRRDGWIVQLPGPDNALGLVKFDMRNEHAIYLHDTPAKQLFEREQRHFSHGCVRVHDALGFARRLAELDGKLAQFEQALASGEETFVALDREIPVRLVYHTVYLGGDGKLSYRLDPYGWDEDVARELGLGEGSRTVPAVHISDIGP